MRAFPEPGAPRTLTKVPWPRTRRGAQREPSYSSVSGTSRTRRVLLRGNTQVARPGGRASHAPELGTKRWRMSEPRRSAERQGREYQKWRLAPREQTRQDPREEPSAPAPGPGFLPASALSCPRPVPLLVCTLGSGRGAGTVLPGLPFPPSLSVFKAQLNHRLERPPPPPGSAPSPAPRATSATAGLTATSLGNSGSLAPSY